MEFPKRILQLVVKTAFVLLIPYSWYSITNYTVSTNSIIGTWGTWSQGGSISWSTTLDPIWAQNQILYSLLFILPLIIFSFIYGERGINRETVLGAGISVALSFGITDILTPDSVMVGPVSNLVVPNVISLSIFIFVFWPILRNSWSSSNSLEGVHNDQGFLNKIRRYQRINFPFDAATFVWVSMLAFPGVMQLSSYLIPETQFQLNLFLSGGLSALYYNYDSVIFSGSNLTVLTGFVFSIASGISLGGLLLWIFNLLLGVTTLHCILGKSTKKRVYILAVLAILITGIPFVISIIVSIMTGLGYYVIPLPLFPIIMVLSTKFIHATSQEELPSEEMIHVPLRARFAGIFMRRKSDQKTPNEETVDNESVSQDND